MSEMEEDCYARRKRYLFVKAALDEVCPKRVLDMGCGTGAMLTLPIASAFAGAEFVGVDSDAASIEWANTHAPPNAHFVTPDQLGGDERFDVVILSEVIEHVDDPPALVRAMRARLRDGGRLLVTVPNGYGPFEIIMFFATALHGPAIKRHLGRLLGRRGGTKQTLAISPHVNFFRLHELRRIFEDAGFNIERYAPTTLFAGPGVGPVLSLLSAIKWNANVTEGLPPWCASGWMFLLAAVAPARVVTFEAPQLSRLRKRLNLMRWSVGS